MAAFEDSDFEKMSEIRSRVDAVVERRETAQNLKAWYRQLCKRPCFHDEYLQAFNRPNVHLVDTDGKGVEHITDDAVVAAGVAYEVDCIIYAPGFEVGTSYTRRAGYDVTGREGVRLSERWADGMRTLHGIHVHGFPNLFLVQFTQGANLISNVPHNLTDSARTISTIVRHTIDSGFDEVEVTREAEDADRAPAVRARHDPRSADCTPGYYNNEGQPGPISQFSVGYPMGAAALPVHRRMAPLRRVRRPRLPLTPIGGATARHRHPHPLLRADEVVVVVLADVELDPVDAAGEGRRVGVVVSDR